MSSFPGDQLILASNVYYNQLSLTKIVLHSNLNATTPVIGTFVGGCSVGDCVVVDKPVESFVSCKSYFIPVFHIRTSSIEISHDHHAFDSPHSLFNVNIDIHQLINLPLGIIRLSVNWNDSKIICSWKQLRYKNNLVHSRSRHPRTKWTSD